MARKFLQKFMPSQERVHSEKALRWLRPILNKPYLWHLNRHTAAKGIGWGFFWAMLPVLGQSIPAVICTVKSRGNVPLAVVATWVSNPFTLIPHWWTAYLIGRLVLRTPDVAGPIPGGDLFSMASIKAITFSWLMKNFWHFYLPLFVGSAIEGAILGILGYLTIVWVWKWHTQSRWRKSRARAAQLAAV